MSDEQSTATAPAADDHDVDDGPAVEPEVTHGPPGTAVVRSMDKAPPLPMQPAKPVSMVEYLREVASPEALDAQRELSERWDQFADALLSPNDYVEVTERGEKKRYKKKSAWKKGARFFNISTRIIARRDNGWSDVDDDGLPHFHADVVVGAWTPWGQYVECVGSCDTRESRFWYTATGPACPHCGGPMYDNREPEGGYPKGKEWKAEKDHFTCKEKSCAGYHGGLNVDDLDAEQRAAMDEKRRIPNEVARGKARHDCYATAETRAQNRAISSLVAAGEVSAEEVDRTGRDESSGGQGAGNGDKSPQRPPQREQGIDLRPLDWTIKSGQRKGKTWREVLHEDRGFVEWMCGRKEGGEVKVKNTRLLKALEHGLDTGIGLPRQPTDEQWTTLDELADTRALTDDQRAWYRGAKNGDEKPSGVAMAAAIETFRAMPLKRDVEASKQDEAATTPDEPQPAEDGTEADAADYDDDLPF